MQRKVRESGTHKDSCKKNISPKPLAGKMKGAEFHEFATSGVQRLEFESLAGLVGIETCGHCSVPEEVRQAHYVI